MDAGDSASIGYRNTPGRDSGDNLTDCRPTDCCENPFESAAAVAATSGAIGDGLGMREERAR